MNDTAIIGAVVLALATLTSLALSVKSLLKPNGTSAANGSHDVTRREFEDDRTQLRMLSHAITDRLQALETKVAVMNDRMRPRLHVPEEEDS